MRLTWEEADLTDGSLWTGVNVCVRGLVPVRTEVRGRMACHWVCVQHTQFCTVQHTTLCILCAADNSQIDTQTLSALQKSIWLSLTASSLSGYSEIQLTSHMESVNSCGVSFWQVLKKVSKYIQEQNEKIYAPQGLLLTDPIERGLRVVSF